MDPGDAINKVHPLGDAAETAGRAARAVDDARIYPWWPRKKKPAATKAEKPAKSAAEKGAKPKAAWARRQKNRGLLEGKSSELTSNSQMLGGVVFIVVASLGFALRNS